MQRLFLSSDQMAAARGTVPSLDGLRAISIMLVLAAHFVDPGIFPGGLGVYVFFVISGFLISRLLLTEHKSTGQISIPMFYMRRVLRLYPVIVAYIICVIGAHIATGRPYNLLEPASALLYFANYFYVYHQVHHIPIEMPFGPFWSLSVEEHFYILFPVTLLLFRGNPRRLLVVLTGLCAGCLGLRILGAWWHPAYLDTEVFYSESQYRIDSIAFGVILALVCEMESGRALIRRMAGPGSALAAAIVVLACLIVRDAWFRETLRYTVLGGAIGVLVAAVLFSPDLRPVQRILNSAVFVWVGRLSYSLYVWHEGVASFVPDHVIPLWQAAAVKLCATLAIATVSFYVVEQPFLRLRRYLPGLRPALALRSSANRRLHATPGA
ncbi:MAG TPA: acyltransferase [Rhodopila sp.]|nr:acyltransferase [Rhodopila sp.]